MAAGVDTEGDGQSPANVDLDPSVELLSGQDELHDDAQANKKKESRSKEFGKGIPDKGIPHTDLVAELLRRKKRHLSYELRHIC